MNNYFGFWGQQDEIIYPLQTGLTACWSLFHRVEDYTGPSIRIRRSSDDSEQDIGFTSAGVLDVADMESFIGSSTGYVLKWYDQKDGIGTDMEPFYLNSGTQYYPIIIDNGITQYDGNGNITIKWGKTNYTAMFAPCNGTRLINAFSGTVYYSHQATTPVSPLGAMAIGGNTNGNSIHMLAINGGTGTSSTFWDYTSPQQYRFITTNYIGILSPDIETNYPTSGEVYDKFITDQKRIICEDQSGWNTLGTGHSIGGRGNGNTDLWFQGFCNEYLIYGSTIHTATQQNENLSLLVIKNSVVTQDLEDVLQLYATIPEGVLNTNFEIVTGLGTSWTYQTVLACNVRIDSSPTDGCLIEKGGTVVGFWAGIRDSGTYFRVRAGDGSVSFSGGSTVPSNTVAIDITDFPKDGNLHNIIIEVNPSGGTLRLWIDGILKGISSGTMLNNQAAGSADGQYLSGGEVGISGEPTGVWHNRTDASGLRVYQEQLVIDI